ncbi:hypothetical protein [Caldifermentibacillus hisashii]
MATNPVLVAILKRKEHYFDDENQSRQLYEAKIRRYCLHRVQL